MKIKRNKIPLKLKIFQISPALLVTLGLLVISVPHAQGASSCSDQIEGKSRAQLEQDLEECNKEIASWTEALNKTKKDSASFTTDIAILTAKINTAKANIKGKNIAIANLTKDIATKQSKIVVLDNRISKGRAAIADIIRKTNEINSFSLAETMFSDKNLSEFFIDINTYASTKEALKDLFTQLREMRALTEVEKAALNKKREAEAAARAALELSKKEVEIDQEAKKTLLAVSKNKEKTYGQVLADRQAKAAQIRAVLFPLRDAGAIPFGLALQYADQASAKTGVRSAFILAILQQESNLGANVGSCLITNLSTGETRSINTGKIFSNGIHPSRDLPPLQDIIKSVGGNPFETKVSCPVSGTLGYGGAMGPAQFIPSTWNLFKDRISSATGKSIPNPWDPADAIMASALYLSDLGAGSGDFTNERTAACKYYSGKTCYSSKGRANVGLSYGNKVMERAGNIQLTMINPLQNL